MQTHGIEECITRQTTHSEIECSRSIANSLRTEILDDGDDELLRVAECKHHRPTAVMVPKSGYK